MCSPTWKQQSVKVYDDCKIADNVVIGEFSVIGKPARPSYGVVTDARYEIKNEIQRITHIRDGCYIGTHVLIEKGAQIGADCVIESRSTVESNAIVGAHCFLVQGSRVCRDSKVGDHCVVGGLLAERSVVGSGSRVFGTLVHKQDDPGLAWDDNIEEAPALERNVFVGKGATVIGGITVGHNSFICAGAVVTKDVLPLHIVMGINKVVPLSQWEGRLKASSFWKDTP